MHVKGVTNLITVKPRLKPSDVKEKIEQALIRSVKTDADRITVDVDGSKVTLPNERPWRTLPKMTREYLIKAELPEMRKEDVKVTVENGVLTISGERKFEKEEKKKKYHRVERGFGTFMRSFALPDDADFSKVNAEFKNGVLTVHVPKSEHAKPKQIDVKVA
jgi:HSP20 family protein